MRLITRIKERQLLRKTIADLLSIYDQRYGEASEYAYIVRHKARVALETGYPCECKNCQPLKHEQRLRDAAGA